MLVRKRPFGLEEEQDERCGSSSYLSCTQSLQNQSASISDVNRNMSHTFQYLARLSCRSTVSSTRGNRSALRIEEVTSRRVGSSRMLEALRSSLRRRGGSEMRCIDLRIGSASGFHTCGSTKAMDLRTFLESLRDQVSAGRPRTRPRPPRGALRYNTSVRLSFKCLAGRGFEYRSLSYYIIQGSIHLDTCACCQGRVAVSWVTLLGQLAIASKTGCIRSKVRQFDLFGDSTGL